MPGYENSQVSAQDPRDFDSDVLRRAQQRVSGDEIQQRSDVISDWLFPNRKEERQLGQQLALMAEEPSIRMEAMKKAGINPLTAAAGIAGSSPSSIPQPSSSVNPIGDVAGAIGSVSSGYGALANGVSTLSKLQPEIDEINSNTKKNLASAGLDKVNTDAVMTDNKYRSENWEAELSVKRQSYKNMQQELDNMKATHDEILKHIDEMQSQIELNGSQQDYYSTMKLKIDEDLRWQKALNDWCLANNLMIRDSGVDGYIFNMLYNHVPDGNVDSFFDAYYDYCKNRSYASSKGQRDAEIDTGFDKAFNEMLGANAANAEYASFFNNLEMNKDIIKSLYQEAFKSPKGFLEAFLKIVQLPSFAAMGGMLLLDNNGVGKPTPTPHSSQRISNNSNSKSHSFRW